MTETKSKQADNISYLYYGKLLPEFKVQMLKPQLFKNLTSGLTVNTYDDNGIMNNKEPVSITYYYTLFMENLITINKRCFDNREYGYTDKQKDEDTFDIYVVENTSDIHNIKEILYSSTKDINECKNIVDSLIDKDYYIFIPSKYVQIAYS